MAHAWEAGRKRDNPDTQRLSQMSGIWNNMHSFCASQILFLLGNRLGFSLKFKYWIIAKTHDAIWYKCWTRSAVRQVPQQTTPAFSEASHFCKWGKKRARKQNTALQWKEYYTEQ